MIGEFLDFLKISFGFPFFDFQPLKAWHSLHLRNMTKPGGATFSCMRPTVGKSFRPGTVDFPQKVLLHLQGEVGNPAEVGKLVFWFFHYDNDVQSPQQTRHLLSNQYNTCLASVKVVKG